MFQKNVLLFSIDKSQNSWRSQIQFFSSGIHQVCWINWFSTAKNIENISKLILYIMILHCSKLRVQANFSTTLRHTCILTWMKWVLLSCAGCSILHSKFKNSYYRIVLNCERPAPRNNLIAHNLCECFVTGRAIRAEIILPDLVYL